jgi:hypothetical protein
MTMAAFAFGLTFGIPNGVDAQTPQLQTDRLPWQTTVFFTGTAPFDNGWTRVLSDTRQLLRRFAAAYQFKDVLTIDAIARIVAHGPLWVPNVHAYIPPTRNPPNGDIGTIRATLTPVEFDSGVAAESRTLQGVLAGVEFEMLD